MEQIGKALVAFGALTVVTGLVMLAFGKGLLRLLPGDIVIRRPNFVFVFPIVTSLVLSIALTLLLWLIAALRR
jgi:hypothetical protein